MSRVLNRSQQDIVQATQQPGELPPDIAQRVHDTGQTLTSGLMRQLMSRAERKLSEQHPDRDLVTPEMNTFTLEDLSPEGRALLEQLFEKNK
jgi:hypothetical protein